jgi:hypothetical protein
VPGERITQHNAVVRLDIANTLDLGGYVITAAPSATSNRVSGGMHMIEPPTLGTLRLMSHPKTWIAIAAGRVLGAPTPSYSMLPEFPILAGNGEQLLTQGKELINQLTAEMNRIDAPTRYAVRS